MKTILEIFYVRIAGRKVYYQRKEANLSRKGRDPDRVIWSLIRQERGAGLDGEPRSEREFVIHSTSWRYERPGQVVLTYVAYSDDLLFRKGPTQSMLIRQLSTITKSSRKPRSPDDLERKVVGHAMRHLAFLIQTGGLEGYESAISPATVEVFKSLWITLAGRVFEPPAA